MTSSERIQPQGFFLTFSFAQTKFSYFLVNNFSFSRRNTTKFYQERPYTSISNLFKFIRKRTSPSHRLLTEFKAQTDRAGVSGGRLPTQGRVRDGRTTLKLKYTKNLHSRIFKFLHFLNKFFMVKCKILFLLLLN